MSEEVTTSHIAGASARLIISAWAGCCVGCVCIGGTATGTVQVGSSGRAGAARSMGKWAVPMA